MAVNFTTYLGLAKPTETEVARNWALNTKLAEDNNIIIQNKVNAIQLTSYTPAFIASTSNPSVGSGSIVGEYWEYAGFIFGNFTIKFGAGTTAGSGGGAYGIRLPVAADTTFHRIGTDLTFIPGDPTIVGEGYITDASVVNNSGIAAIDIITTGGFFYARMLTEAIAAKASRFFGPTNPFTVVDGDQVSGNYIYKKA